MQFGNISFYNILEIFKNESFDKITTFSFSYSYSFEPCSMLMVAFFFNTFFAILHSMWDFGSLTRNQSNRHPLAMEARSLNHWTSSKVPSISVSEMSSLSVHLLPVALVHPCSA